MKVISEIYLPFLQTFSQALPVGSKILSFQSRENAPLLIVQHDNITAETMIKKHQFSMLTNGAMVPDAAKYIGTANFKYDSIFAHLYELP